VRSFFISRYVRQQTQDVLQFGDGSRRPSNRIRRGFTMPDIEYIRAEIERMRTQVHRQRGEIRQLQKAGIPTISAEALLDRMLNNIDALCAERDRLKKEQPGPCTGKVLGGRRW
jgi:hypothetical protein